ncbi:hypothetical protein TWF694_011372 [Orbilia ellipsospora]|uniref:Uncharacterized protein n=1 Tax=Orbilia ellipsospora TaxID=2528407 RepID=A0AAV9X544_9PEZI
MKVSYLIVFQIFAWNIYAAPAPAQNPDLLVSPHQIDLSKDPFKDINPYDDFTTGGRDRIQQNITGSAIKTEFMKNVDDWELSEEQLKFFGDLTPKVWNDLAKVENKLRESIFSGNPSSKFSLSISHAWNLLFSKQIPDFNNLQTELH